MSRRRTLAWIVAATAATIGVIAGVVLLRPSEDDPPPTTADDTPVAESAATADEPLVCDLYFPGGRQLHAERREIPAGPTEEKVRSLVEALLAGPRTQGLAAPLPGDVTVQGVFLGRDRIYLDLRSPEGAPPPASGSLAEMLAVYSLVDTVLLNLGEEAASLVLLWNGQQLVSLAGHLDTSRPLTVNRALIAASSRPEPGP